MTTLSEWLLAQIAEDEAAWKRSAEFRVRLDLTGVDMTMTERVLAECEAKRRIVELHTPLRHVQLGREDWFTDECSTCLSHDGWEDQIVMEQLPCPTLRALALPYADRPGYDETWRP